MFVQTSVNALEKACATAAAAPEYEAIVERLGASARYLPGAVFRKMFEQDSVAAGEAIKRAGLGAGRQTQPMNDKPMTDRPTAD